MAGIGMIFSVLSAGLGAMGAIAEGKAQQQAANFNAKALKQQAASERDIARVEAGDYRRAEMRKMSSARTARLATGVTMAGSPLLVDEAAIREVSLGVQRTRFGGAIKANRLEQEAQLEKMKGKAAVKASYFKAGTSILGSFGPLFG